MFSGIWTLWPHINNFLTGQKQLSLCVHQAWNVILKLLQNMDNYYIT